MPFPLALQKNLKFNEEEIHQEISYYQQKIKSVATCSDHEAPLMLKTFIEGIAKIGNIQAEVYLAMNQAKKQRKHSEAIVLLEKYPEWCKEQKKKGTIAEGQSFQDIDKDVQQARDQEYYFEALHQYLQNTRQTLVYAHDDLKKIVYSSNDYRDRSPIHS